MALAGWLVVAVVAFALVLTVLGFSGAGMFDSTDRPMSAADAAQLLANLPSAPVPPGGAGVSADSVGIPVVTSAGTARITCQGGTPEIVYVSPAPGFSYSEKPTSVPVPTVYILIAGQPNSVQIAATCPNGLAKATVS
jgi:hypothetical protein